MKNKIISITLSVVFCLSIVFNNSVLSIASDNADFDYTRFYIENNKCEEKLIEDKYIEIDSKEDYDEMKKYDSNWDDAIDGYKVIEGRKYDYPFYIRFFAQKNMTHDKVKEMLSKYDTNFLFGYTYPSDYRIKCIKDLLNCTYYTKVYSNRTVKVSNSVINEKFQGTDEQLLELFECIRKDSCYNFIYDSEKISYDDFRYLETIVMVQSRYMINDESRYYVRFNNKEEYLNAIEELNNNEDIFVEANFSSEIYELKANSIIVTYPCEYNINSRDEIDDFEKNLLDTIKDDLSDYDLNYSELFKCKPYAVEYILSIENIKEEDLEDICSILYKRAGRNPSRIEDKPAITFYITGENRCVYIYNKDFDFHEKEPTDEQNKKTRYQKLYRVQESDGKVYIISDVDIFYISISEDCIIYPMYITKELGEHTIIKKLYNPNTGEHLFISKSSEYSTLTKNGWKFQRSVFLTDDSKDEDLKEVYRVYNPNVKGGDHHYTMSYNEASNLVKKGWKWDNNAKPVFYSGGDVEVYRLYNKNNGRHYYTKNVGEKNKLVKLGWKYEGVAWTVLE